MRTGGRRAARVLFLQSHKLLLCPRRVIIRCTLQTLHRMLQLGFLLALTRQHGAAVHLYVFPDRGV